ncbi:MAG: large-conductance mechanosensitive channel protein MscL [Phototrophicaceae bacterium]
MLQEFQKFILRGNVMDLAIGIIIGTAFTAIVNSLVNDIIMPPIGLIIGGVDFSNIVITLKEATADTEAVTIGIGLFINALIQFLIIAFVVFMLVRAVNNLVDRFDGEEEEPVDMPPTTEEKLLVAIEDLTAAVKAQK